MEKKEYRAPKLQSHGSIAEFTFATPGGNNEEEFSYYYHHYHRHRRPHSWSEESLPNFPNS